MSSLCETRFEYRDLGAEKIAIGPMEKLWHSRAEDTVFLSATELRAREREWFDRGARESEIKLNAEHERTLASTRAEVFSAIRELSRDREAYFRAMESEVVRLALSVARAAIGKELSEDPALLHDVVRESLSRIEGRGRVTLHVPAADLRHWRELFDSESDFTDFEIQPDSRLVTGKCRVVAETGCTEIDVHERLKEIEDALANLAAERNPKSIEVTLQ